MTIRWVFVAAATAVLGAPSSVAAQAPKKIAVVTFDQSGVNANLNDIFGRPDVQVGSGLAKLVGQRLTDAGGFELVEVSLPAGSAGDPSAAASAGRAAGADAVVTGTLIGFGNQSATAGVTAGPRVAGMRLGIGRRTTVAAVVLETRLVDVASGQLLTTTTGQGTASRSGVGLFVRVPGLISQDGQIDMTLPEYGSTLIGEATNQAVAQIVTEISSARGQIGTLSAPAPVAAAPAMAAPMPSGPVAMPSGPFAWAPYRFKGTEHFRYNVTKTEDNETSNGFYQLDFTPASPGQVRMRVQGQLGTDSYSSTVTVPVAQEGGSPMMMGMGMGQLMALGPVGIMLFNPTAWIFMYGHQLTVGDEWSSTSDGESVSVKVDATCSAAGQGGVLVVMRENGEVRHESCVAPEVALPLRVMMTTDDSRIEMTLTEYHP
jgi:curli biogenesis system outer membrane secretion channel CsgG